MAFLQSSFVLLPILFVTSLISMSSANSTIVDSHNLFANDIFKAIATERAQENVVFSPASIQTCLILAYLGAEGNTAQEMQKGLKLPIDLDKSGLALEYSHFIKNRFNIKQTDKADAPKLRLANRIYVNELLQISPAYNELAKKSFDSEAVSTKFSEPQKAAQSINTWVENQTEGKIKDLIQADSLTPETSAILVNAIYFKAKWLKPFSELATANAEFKMAGGKKSNVPTMFGDERLKYGKLESLDATAIEMPYKDSDLSMLLILPNKDDGLLELEQKLAFTDLNQIENHMRKEHVEVFLPKFRVEFDIDLKEPLRKLGLSEMFSNSADFSSIFTDKQSQKVDEVKHKAFIDVNEAGSEAAATTYMKIIPMSLILDQKVFKADHPFVFAIRDKQAIYFVGHVAKL